ncbi:MAG: Triosephosphate isomerase [Candidatus Magasanikbacteria bacterium GW2011_GWA2_46_17]|uniref:Triosephosphate isomerase n=1 Tax=Candidatus Magasanikbacteria bacterium GW2011_GWA2_46_17 TaxID=1619042 RepID=A0A0G1RYA9_9BACT|nr:MAG: Triosephosphate isomerase [Candidatus Magasanikbacteria bacterium GW2011_GWA2_46_17]
MNPETAARAQEIFRAVSRRAKQFKTVDVVICPPIAYLSLFKKPSRKHFFLGVQDVFWERIGAYTGQISPVMALGLGASFAIVGHSERRAQGETDEVVSKKVFSAARSGLRVILCVGERERNSGGAYFEFLKNQIRASLAGARSSDLKKILIAYEPVWAIGRSFKEAMKPADVYEITLFIKKVLTDLFSKDAALSVPILYGGSVNFENAGPIIKEGNVDGLLVGRESLDPENFGKLLSTINESQ